MKIQDIVEFAPGSGDGESGRWYTDDQMTDLVGDGWWEDMDVAGNISKQQMIQQAQAWLDDQGYSVQVLNAKLNDDDMDWFIQGSFYNPNFAKKGVTEAKADPTGSWVVYKGSKVTKFKTHTGAKAYAEKNGGQVASSEYYHDKIQKQGVAEAKQRLDAKCWDGYKKQGTKMKGDTRVNNCVPESIDADQKKAKQVPATEMPKKTSPVLGKAPKQHPFKGRAVGGGL